jgi:TonB family C-terminal domain
MARSSSKAILFLHLILSFCVFAAHAQSPAPQTDAEALQKRIARARALAAAQNLTAAAFELDAIRNSTTDDAVRDVARIMLVGIYLEQSDYGRAQNVLEETFKAHTPQNEGSSRSYFAVAGQAVKGVRAHLDRYRAFGFNLADRELPGEAVNDLDKVRALLERIVEQAKQIGAGDDRNTDAFALLEDVANVRAGLSKNGDDRARWQTEVAEARQRLAASETRLTSLTGGIATANTAPVLVASKSSIPSTPPPAQTSNEPAPATSQPAATTTTTVANETAPKPASDQPVNVGPLVDKAMQKVSPTYPSFAKNARVTGIVRVDLVIDEKGVVAVAQSSSGPELLRQAAVDAARRWRFRPTVKDGQPVKVSGFINFNFML